MKCPKCKSSNIMQLGVNDAGRSNLLCLDCDWDNMREISKLPEFRIGKINKMGTPWPTPNYTIFNEWLLMRCNCGNITNIKPEGYSYNNYTCSQCGNTWITVEVDKIVHRVWLMEDRGYIKASCIAPESFCPIIDLAEALLFKAEMKSNHTG